MKEVFQASCSKLEDCRTYIKTMKSVKNGLDFKAAFTSFLSSARAITYALQKEGAHISGFNNWYIQKQEEMKNDALLRFVHEARTKDFHEGRHGLKFSLYIYHFSSKKLDIHITPDAPLLISGDGIYQIINKGTPKERRVPIEAGNYQIFVSIENPPKEHLGKKIRDPNPLNLCEIAIEYYETLIFQAKSLFSIK